MNHGMNLLIDFVKRQVLRQQVRDHAYYMILTIAHY